VHTLLTYFRHTHLISTARCFVYTLLVTFRYDVCSAHRKHQYVPILQASQSRTKFPRIYMRVNTADPLHVPTRMFQADILTQGAVN
jgi:hypothetical protein